MEMFRKYNYFITEYNSGQYGCLKSLMSFMGDLGYNFLLLLNNKNYYKSPFRGGDIYHKEFTGIEEFESILEDSSNLFRIDIILLDLIGMGKKESIKHIKSLDKLDGYTYYIMVDYKDMDIDEETVVYDIKTSLVGDVFKLEIKSAYELTNMETKSTFTLTNFFKQYKRTLIIDRVLKNKGK